MATTKLNNLESILGVTETAHASTGNRSIPLAAELNADALARTDAFLKKLPQNKDVAAEIRTALDSGDYQQMVDCINKIDADITCDKIKDASENELKRMLESRRSDRCKAKATGLKDMTQIRRYIAATIAEMMLRKQMNFEYKANTGTTLDADELAKDQDALNRKIRSLQSKQSILKNKSTFAPADWDGWKQLDEVKQQIAELQARRISTHTTGTKTVSMTAVKTALASMSEEQIQELLAQAKALQNV